MQPTTSADRSERLNLREHGQPFFIAGIVAGAIGMVAALAMGYLKGDSFHQFYFAYLTGYMFFLTIALGGLFFTILQHLTKAAWSVNIRRITEWLAASMPLMAVLSLPIIVAVLMQHGDLYSWSDYAVRKDFLRFKRIYLNPMFFIVRLIAYFIVWSGMGLWYRKQSVLQDTTGDLQLTVQMQKFAPPAMLLFAVTLTLAAFDLLMSLDPGWTSTIFGVYIFAGSALSMFATVILTVMFLQSLGYLKDSVSSEHFHDMGKFLFGFTFFYGYIAFSQFMLQWYGNLPEETEWYSHRGATTAVAQVNAWSVVILMVLFGQVLIPFAGLLSRHVKRCRAMLAFWAIWQLVFHWVDLFWIVRPQMTPDNAFDLGIIDLAVFVGVGGLFFAMVVRTAGLAALRPLRDPRLSASLAFENQ